MDMLIPEAASSQAQTLARLRMPTQIMKRDGSVTAFDPRRITTAIVRAGNAADHQHGSSKSHQPIGRSMRASR